MSDIKVRADNHLDGLASVIGDLDAAIVDIYSEIHGIKFRLDGYTFASQTPTPEAMLHKLSEIETITKAILDKGKVEWNGLNVAKRIQDILDK